MVFFHSYVNVYQRVGLLYIPRSSKKQVLQQEHNDTPLKFSLPHTWMLRQTLKGLCLNMGKWEIPGIPLFEWSGFSSMRSNRSWNMRTEPSGMPPSIKLSNGPSNVPSNVGKWIINAINQPYFDGLYTHKNGKIGDGLLFLYINISWYFPMINHSPNNRYSNN